MNIDKDIEDLEKYISFSKKDENFSNITDYVWHKELGKMIERTLSELETYKKMFEEIVEDYMNEFTGCNDVKEFTEYLRKKVQK